MQRRILLLLFLISALVNLIAALGPELGFDALWYHLTIPKIYLMWGKIDFIPGGLMYYSAMPRLGELIFLFFKANDIFAHLICWGAGIGAALITYKIARKYQLSIFYSLLSAVIFYVTPLVGWQSGSAYVDLIRTFFEALAFYLFFTNPILAGVSMGLAIGTKTLALGSLGILSILSFLNKKNPFKFIFTTVLVSVPWFVWAYLKTSYPFYPIGARILDSTHSVIFPTLASLSHDSIVSPIYLMVLPFLFFTKIPRQILGYIVLTLVVWFFTPHTSEGRFLLPYLPIWAVGAGFIIKKYRNLIPFCVLIFIAIIGYRSIANLKVIPYILGRESKTEYLCKHLDFSTRVFVDCTGEWAKKVKSGETVLIKGYHNLYYVNFPFIHETWYKGEKVDYILEYK